MAANGDDGDFFAGLPSRPGPTPDIEYIQNPADQKWYPIPKEVAPTAPVPQPVTPAPAPLGWGAQFVEDLRHSFDNTSAGSIAHENILANLARGSQRLIKQYGPEGITDEQANAAIGPLGAALANRQSDFFPESRDETEGREIADAASRAEPLSDKAAAAWQGIKSLPSEAIHRPGRLIGGLAAGAVQDPELLLAPEVMGARAATAGAGLARMAGAGEKAAAVAGKAAELTVPGAVFSGAPEAAKQFATGDYDPYGQSAAAVQGAVLGPVLHGATALIKAPLARALSNPATRETFNTMAGAAGTPDADATLNRLLSTDMGDGAGPSGPTGPTGGMPGPDASVADLARHAANLGVPFGNIAFITRGLARKQLTPEQATQGLRDLIRQHQGATNENANPAAASGQEENAGQGAGEPEGSPDAGQQGPAGQQPTDASGATEAEGTPAGSAGPAAPESADGGNAAGSGSEPDVAAAAPAPKVELLEPDETGHVETEVAGQPVRVNVQPTELQKATGNYSKGHVNVAGLPITIENPAGTVRSGTDRDGTPWESTLSHAYGYVKGTTGADGDHVDTFVGPNPEARRVYVVDQVDPKTGEFDEHKAMVGFDSQAEAEQAYAANYPNDWQGKGAVHDLSVPEFRKWLREGDTRKPMGGTPAAAKPAEATPEAAPEAAAQAPAKPKAPRAPRAGTEGGPPVLTKVHRDRMDPRTDSLMQYLAKHPRGIDRKEAEAQGIDPSMFKDPRAMHGIKYAFRHGGMTFDEAAEHLWQRGYPVTDEDGRYNANTLLDRIDDELRGKKVYSGHNQTWMTDQANLEDYYREENRRLIEAAAQEEDTDKGFVPGWHEQEPAERELTVMAAEAQHYDPAAVERLLEKDDEDYIRRGLQEIIEHGRYDAEEGYFGSGHPPQFGEAGHPGEEEEGGFELKRESPDELRERGRAENAAAETAEKERLAAETKAAADKDRDQFELTGSKRASDANPRQSDLLGLSQAPSKKPTVREQIEAKKTEAVDPESVPGRLRDLMKQHPEGLRENEIIDKLGIEDDDKAQDALFDALHAKHYLETRVPGEKGLHWVPREKPLPSLKGGGEPNKNGVYSKDSPGIETIHYASDKTKKPIAKAEIHVGEFEDGKWAVATQHDFNTGTMEGARSPITYDHTTLYNSRDEAVRAANEQLQRNMQSAEKDTSSVSTPKQKQAARDLLADLQARPTGETAKPKTLREAAGKRSPERAALEKNGEVEDQTPFTPEEIAAGRKMLHSIVGKFIDNSYKNDFEWKVESISEDPHPDSKGDENVRLQRYENGKPSKDFTVSLLAEDFAVRNGQLMENSRGTIRAVTVSDEPQLKPKTLRQASKKRAANETESAPGKLTQDEIDNAVTLMSQAFTGGPQRIADAIQRGVDDKALLQIIKKEFGTGGMSLAAGGQAGLIYSRAGRLEVKSYDRGTMKITDAQALAAIKRVYGDGVPDELREDGGRVGEEPKPEEPPQPEEPGFKSNNKFFTDDDAEAALNRLKSKLNRANAGLDPELVQDGITLAGWYIEKGARSFAEFAKKMLAALGDDVKPYLKSWYLGVKFDPRSAEFAKAMDRSADVEDADVEQIAKEHANDERGRRVLESDRAGGPDERSGQAVLPADERGAGGEAGRGRGRAGEEGLRSEGGEGVPGDSASPSGTGGDLPVREEGSDLPPDSAGGGGHEGGLDARQPGAQSEHVPAGTVKRAAERPLTLEAKVRRQRAAEDVPYVPYSRDNIGKMLPFLNEGQQDDVHFAEMRFGTPSGHGVLFTNGTGTGKTYTGLGIVKRFQRQGMDNILIVAPSDKIISDWIDSGKNLGLDISKLEDTKTAGKGIVATTYANMGQNRTLADRKWDLIVPDEAHYLAANQNGDLTDAGKALQAIALHPQGYITRAYLLHRDTADELAASHAAMKARMNPTDEGPSEEMQANHRRLLALMAQHTEAVKREVEAAQAPGQRPKVAFLSATPFAYDKAIHYAEGFLFDYPADDNRGGYNVPKGRDAYMVQHFGYRMRTNKLTEPDAEVNRSLMQVQWNEMMQKSGALSTRLLNVEHDYERRFLLAQNAIGQKIDEGLEYLHNHMDGKYRPLLDQLEDTFTYHNRMFLLEALKAKDAVKRIQQHLDAGRKVVLFHDFNKGGGFHPFKFAGGDARAFDSKGRPYSLSDLIADFERERPDLANLDFADLKSPLETMKAAFPDALFFNGTVPKKQRRQAVDLFNNDDGRHRLIVVQNDAGREGISLHDTTGKYRRVEMNLGMPIRPTAAIQQEGRIYRTGQASNALFEYMNTGTNFERWTFAKKIAERADAVESLAVGNLARALKEGFVDAFNDAEPARPPSEDDGQGGKEKDRARAEALSPFQKAKTFYFGQQKKTLRTKAAEGKDYFATPEPLGQKMVEWAGIRPGESALEPSAGHGAIARWFPDYSKNTYIEPSAELASRLALVAEGKHVIDRFENHHVGANKYDAIVMNPPFGTAGKTAIGHVEKAAQHLRDGGRIVALIPEGSATDKRFDQWLYGKDDGSTEGAKDMYLVANIHLPAATFERAGTAVRTRVVVLDKASSPDRVQHAADRDYSSAESIGELFDRIENAEVPARAAPAPEPQPAARPAAGSPPNGAPPPDLGGAPAAAGEPPEGLVPANFNHSRTGAAIYGVRVAKRLAPASYSTVNAKAKSFGGYYSSFKGGGAVPGFLFKTEQARQAFLANVRPSDLYARGGSVAAGGGPRADVRAFYQDAAKALQGVADVQVHDTPEDMAAALGYDVPPDVRGAYVGDDGTVHLVVSGAKSLDTAQRTLAHEVVGHFAAERMPEFAQALELTQKLQKAGGKEINRYWDRVDRTHPGLDDVTHAKETLAAMAEDGVKNSLVDRAIAAVARFLRRIGIKVAFTAAELRQMLVRALRGFPEDAQRLMGEDRVAGYDADGAVAAADEARAAGKETEAAVHDARAEDALGRILPQTEATDTYTAAQRAGDTRTMRVLEDVSRPLAIPDSLFAATAPPFYSGLTEAVRGLKQGKATPEQWAGMIDNLKGVKKEEVEWSGVKDWLRQQRGSVTREALERHLRDNEVQLKDVVHGMNDFERDRIVDQVEKLGYKVDAGDGADEPIMLTKDGLIQYEDDLPPEARRLLDRMRENDTRYEQYTLPGGENYREHLITLADKAQDNQRTRPTSAQIDALHDALKRSGYEGVSDEQRRILSRGGTDAVDMLDDWAQRLSGDASFESMKMYTALAGADKPAFRTGHWDEPNILAHVRMLDRKTESGKRMLHIEELQSDWHQAGRKRGYQGDETAPNGVPNAPFKTTWHELALKRMVRHAAENGYDSIGWTPGEQQAERYDLSKKVDAIHFNPRNGYFVARNKGQKVFERHDVTPEQIPDIIGKEASERLLASKPLELTGMLQLNGTDLKMGGEGMRGFYDKILPDAANKLFKKYGAKVGKEMVHAHPGEPDIMNGEDDDIGFEANERYDIAPVDGGWQAMDGNAGMAPTGPVHRSYQDAKRWIRDQVAAEKPAMVQVHSLPITPELRQVAMSGQPLFARAEAPSDEEAMRPVEGPIPKNVLFARGAPIDPDIQDIRDRVMDADGRGNLSLKDRLRLGIQAIRNVDTVSVVQGLIDDLHSLEMYERELNGGKEKDAAESPTKAARGTRNLASVMTAVLKHGIPEYRDGNYHLVDGHKGLQEILAPIADHADGNLVPQWELYAAARRASRLIRETNRDGTSREKNFTQADIDKALALAKKYPEFNKAFDEWQKFNKQLLDFAQEAGIIDPEARELWEHNDYVPFYRVMDEASNPNGPGNRRGIMGQRSGIRTLTGSEEKVGNIVENIVMNTAHLIDASYKNRAAQRVVDSLNGVAVTPEPLAWEANSFSNAQLAAALKRAGVTIDPKMTKAQREAWSKLFRRVAPVGNDIVSVMRDGKPAYYRVLDPVLHKAITAIGGDLNSVLGSGIMRVLSGPKRTLTAAATWTPRFLVANFIRDTAATWVQANTRLGVMSGAGRGFVDAMRNQRDLYNIMINGGGGSSRYDSDPKSLRKLLMQAKVGNPDGFAATVANPRNWWKWYQQVAFASEHANRLRVFRAALKNGASVAEAAYQARDVLDFSMHGGAKAMQLLNAMVPFLNARAQGLYRTYRGFKDNWRAHLVKGGLIAGLTLALYGMNQGNPDYQELPEWDKDAFWHIFWGGPMAQGGHHVRIPRPFEIGALFATIPERVGRLLAADDKLRNTWDSMKSMLGDTFALNPTPQFVRPLLNDAANKDSFGRPILSEHDQGVLPQEQYGPGTSPTLQALARAMPDAAPDILRSPKRLQQLAEGYFAALATTSLDAADWMTRRGLGYPDAPQTPMGESAVRFFYQEGEPRSTKWNDEFYRMMQESNKVHASITQLAKDQRIDDARALMQEKGKQLAVQPTLNAIGKELRELSAQRRTVVMNQNIDADRKREIVNRIDSERNALVRRAAPFEDLF